MYKSSLFLVLVFLLSSFNAVSQNSITVSPIGPQVVMAGGRIPIFFSAVNGKFDGIIFSSEGMPDFVTMDDDPGNAGRFIVNSNEGDEGVYDFNLLVSDNEKSASIPIHLTVLSVTGNKYYCDPTSGNIDNSGDFDHPWATLEEVFSSNKKFQDGDVIFLRSGYHGAPNLKGYGTTAQYIVAQSNHTPEVSKFSFGSCSRWNVAGLIISPEVIGTTSLDRLVQIRTSSLFNVLENCEIYGIKNSEVWNTNQKWYDNCPDGIWCDGKNSIMRNNYIYNTAFTVHINSKYSKFIYNTIDLYASDAIRGLANNTEYSYNVIKNPVVDDYATGNHDDAFQSWTDAFGPPKKDIIIRGNQVFNATYPGIPLSTSIMQGIINFDGFSENWEISNNLLVQDHWHGITLVGAKNCKIINNTVIKNPLNTFQFGNPWIGIWPTKESAGNVPSTGNLVRNNITATYANKNDEPGSKDHNLISGKFSDIFVDYNGWDFRLKSSLAIDKGNQTDAPLVDIEGKRRNIGTIDIGCYEKDAILTDFVNPTGTIIGQGNALSSSTIKLNWNEIDDTNGIDHYVINYDHDSKQISTDLLVATINGLRANTTYTFSITAFDNFGNASNSSQPFEVTTLANSNTMSVYFIPATKHDQQIKSNKKLMWVGMPEIQIGGAYSEKDACAVFPFKIPLLPQNYKITSANFITNLIESNGTPKGGVDLYGIKFRKKDDVLKKDFWQGNFGNGTETSIENNYISTSNNTGSIDLSDTGKSNLATYIEQNIMDGAKANDFLFLRLNSGIPDEDNDAFYTVSSADNNNTAHFPILKIIANAPTGIKPIYIESGVNIFPNPPVAGNINLHIQGFNIGKPIDVILHNSMGQQVFKKIFVLESDQDNINIDVDLPKGAYFITILGDNQFSEGKCVIQ